MWATDLDSCRDAADYAYCTCAVYSCGYSQANRTDIGLRRLREGTAETDCSAGVSWWLFMGGLIDVCPWFATSYEREWLTERGFETFDFGDRELERNDVLWMPGHTGLYIGEGMQAEALRDEHHGKGDGASPGDQDEGETVVRPLTYGWKQVLRKPGAATSGTMEGDDMTFLFTCDGVHADHVYLYDGLQVRLVATYDQQEVVKEAYRMCKGTEIPMFHLAGGDHLIALVNGGPVT